MRERAVTTAAPQPGRLEPAWLRGAVGYEAYIRSFADGDGDGIGDLPGLTARLEHLAWLGIDLLWVTPFFPSPGADHGYDVAGYTDVDPLFGTLADAERLVAEARELGIRVLLDIVANHTSDRHPWFRDARSSREAAHRDWYVWADPAPDGGPPNNWVSYFGGPAWTYEDATGQYYLHLFLPEQPDLNWRNPAVVEALSDALRFWLERGVAGFRLDVAQGFIKDAALRSNPQLAPLSPGMSPRETWDAFAHDHDIDQPANVDVYRALRRVVDEHDALLFGEVYLLPASRLTRYVADGALSFTHYFSTMHVAWDASALREVLEDGVRELGARAGWVQCSHDDPRSSTRFGGGERGRERALALATLFAALPGVPFLYQGEELGLEQAVLAPELLHDPVAVRAGALAHGRDGTRTPMPWTTGPGRGFTAGEPWLPFGRESEGRSVEEQRADPRSVLSRQRRLIAVRRTLPDATDEVAFLDVPGCIAFRRGAVTAIANAGAETVDVGSLLGVEGRVRFRSDGGPVDGPARAALPPDAAMLVVHDER